MQRTYQLILLLTLFLYIPSYAQKGNYIWYFGTNAGLDFRTSPPTPLTDGALVTSEGCATISNDDGNLLFYTDGINVWNKNHDLMPNGTGLNGHPSSSQTGVVVPKPYDPDIYYIFTIYAYDANTTTWLATGLQYSEVDMTLDGGLGDITVKNTPLLAPATEKVTSVLHQNGQEIWVITHSWDNNAFYAFRVSNTGVNTTPVISNVGDSHTNFEGNSQGYLKTSLDGTRLALARTTMLNVISPRLGRFEVFDFDATSGSVSNPIVSDAIYRQIYGIEFSPDGNKLYFANNSNTPGVAHDIYQVNLQAGTSTDIINSATIIGTSPRPTASSGIGAFQLGRDGRIYVARAGETFLGVIQNPNELGAASNYVSNGISLSGRVSRAGLPNFIYGFDALGVVLSSPLTLSGKLENQSVQLSWQVSSNPMEDKVFEIYRSNDAMNLQKMVTFKGSELNQINGKYQWTDENLPANMARLYYKIIQKDKEGKQTESNWISIAQKTMMEVQISPNPTQAKLQVKMENPLDKTVTLTLSNAIGTVLWQRSYATNTQDEWKEELNFSGFGKGLYFLQIQNSKGFSVKKVVIE